MSTNTRVSAVVLCVLFCSVGCKNEASADERKPEMSASTLENKESKSQNDEKSVADKSDEKTKTLDETTKSKASETSKATSEKTKMLTTGLSNPAGTGTTDKTELVATEGLELAELTVARGIEAKKPLDPKTVYKLGEYDRIVAFMSVLNPAETEDEIYVSFLNVETGKERGKVSVSVGAQKKWRTWAFNKTINKTGKWEILVRDKNDQVLGRAPFEILSAE